MSYKVIALPTAVAEAVRRDMLSPKYRHPANRSLATGYGPCCHCLYTFKQREEDRILFTYDPFDGISEFALPGPIYIHAEACPRYPEEGGFPEPLLQHSLTIQAYGDDRRLIEEVRFEGTSVEPLLTKLLADAATTYLHVRDTKAGCYDFRVERAE
ncbi:MAG: DUF1203 domain-containing protein [Acidobacteriales bacterium]|nr:DUF1203 domain-containing protein [Terriglobales bacterium]